MNSREQLNMQADVTFGTIELTTQETEVLHSLNSAVLDLCRELPTALQNDTLLFLMQYTGNSSPLEINFFVNYHVPAWTPLCFLMHNSPLQQQSIRALAAAMLLHSIDDHLVDGALETTHLMLALRSALWKMYSTALDDLTRDTAAGKKITRGNINSYYEGVHSQAAFETIKDYCSNFRKEMATWTTVIHAAAVHAGFNSEKQKQLRRAYEYFGLAWRMLDDIQDLEQDYYDGAYSSLYFYLKPDQRQFWGCNPCTIPQSDIAAAQRKAIKQTEALCRKSSQYYSQCGLHIPAQQLTLLSTPLKELLQQ
jgi:hypothetical protein